MPVHCGMMGGGETGRAEHKVSSVQLQGWAWRWITRAQYESSAYTGSFQARPVNRKRRQDERF